MPINKQAFKLLFSYNVLDLAIFGVARPAIFLLMASFARAGSAVHFNRFLADAFTALRHF
jgi:hypothetical protein